MIHFCALRLWFFLESFVISELILSQKRPIVRWNNRCILRIRDESQVRCLYHHKAAHKLHTYFEIRTCFGTHPILVGSKATHPSPHTGFYEAKQERKRSSCDKVDRNFIYIPAHGGLPPSCSKSNRIWGLQGLHVTETKYIRRILVIKFLWNRSRRRKKHRRLEDNIKMDITKWVRYSRG